MSDRAEDLEDEFASNRVPGRMYISKRFPYQGESEDDQLTGLAARFGWTVQDAAGDVEVFDDKGFEVVVHQCSCRRGGVFVAAVRLAATGIGVGCR